ncbi:MAG: aspartate/glutamate racemase family protein [Thermoleophilia bacterium]
MPKYRLDPNPQRVAYGTAVGILLLDARVPFVPGDVGNHSTYNFPVVYRVVEGLFTKRIIEGDPAMAEPIIRAAQELEKEGVAGITADCGYMARFQKQVASSVNIPVFLSSWMQVPFISRILPRQKKVAAIVADSRFIRKEILENAGIDSSIPLVIGGMETKPAFASAILKEEGVLDTDLVEAEVIEVACDLLNRNPDVGAIFLECSCLPPYSAAVQRALGLPVFDFISMINFVYSSLAKKPYIGTIY